MEKNNQKNYTSESISQMDKRFRTNFVNSLSGFKSLQLAGTISKEGRTNLAPINSVVHIGANPPLIGMVLRPHTVPRQTLENIMATGVWTLSNVLETYYAKAHQCAARYDDQTSEFSANSLEEFYGSLPVPYVEEASVKIGLKLAERVDLKANGTHLLIGEVVEVFISDEILTEDGTIDLERGGSLTVAGLDSYHRTEKLARLSYPKIGTSPREIK